MKHPSDFSEGDTILVVGKNWASLERVARTTRCTLKTLSTSHGSNQSNQEITLWRNRLMDVPAGVSGVDAVYHRA